MASKHIWGRSLKWGTKHWFWSRGCKDIRGQSWRLKKISANSADPGRMGSNWADQQIFLWTSNFDLWQFYSLLSHIDAEYLIWNSSQILYGIVSNQEHSSTFEICYLYSKCPHLCDIYLVRICKWKLMSEFTFFFKEKISFNTSIKLSKVWSLVSKFKNFFLERMYIFKKSFWFCVWTWLSMVNTLPS